MGISYTTIYIHNKIMLKKINNWLSEQPAIQRFARFRKEFKYIWLLLLIISGTCLLAHFNMIHWTIANCILRISLCLIAIQFIIRPMNAVYGLMGTSGSIHRFFLNFFFITLLFAGVYHWAFFNNAGISYDVNQPHIDFQKYAVSAKANTTKVDLPTIIVSTKRDTVYVEHKLDTASYTETIIQTRVTRDTIMPLQYQPIGFLQVWRSTILTTLTQESADLLAIATVHNEAMESTDVGLDKEKSELFEWILIFHIIISWIFFGVFISLLYNKFRYES